MFNPMPELNYLKSILDYNPTNGEFRWIVNGNNQFDNSGCIAGYLTFSKTSNSYYRKIMVKGKAYYAHRIAYYIITGIDPLDNLVDHKNNNTLDNAFYNLRLATHRQNNENSKKRKNNKCGLKGVSWNEEKQKYRAQIKHKGKVKNLGNFNTPEEAHEAYKKASEELHKEFGRTK